MKKPPYICSNKGERQKEGKCEACRGDNFLSISAEKEFTNFSPRLRGGKKLGQKSFTNKDKKELVAAAEEKSNTFCCTLIAVSSTRSLLTGLEVEAKDFDNETVG